MTLNQDDNGAGVGTISNSNPSNGSNPFFQIAGGALTLADGVLVSNTGNSTRANGAIILNTLALYWLGSRSARNRFVR